ncbi:right-handed parallel beta-helix repeat-containing protein [Micromonospora sp. NPDC049460]|uniref:right-handed parallel beta-helix repeat-containing protein n=1 Tax=Micromonospora sp. NPDC049460 TaxID=3364272 RepID=UPI00378FC59E
MSDDVTTPDGGPPAGTPTRGRRKLWVAAGVAGLTGVVGLAALGGLASRDDKSGDTDRLSDARSTAPRQNVSDAGKADEAGGAKTGQGEDDWSGQGDRKQGNRKHDDREKEVPCDTDKLIQAITEANKNHGATLKLAKHCTYELTRSEHGNGLPVIKQPIVLKGDDTKIVRAADTERFRILNVGSSGHLTLKNVTIKGGQTVARKMVSPPAAPPVATFGLSGSTTAAAAPARPAMAAPTPSAAAPGTPATLAEPATAEVQPDGTATAVPGLVSADGAGLLVQRGGHADLEYSTFAQNQAGGNGGGIANFGTTNVRHTSVENNSADGFGGGIFNVGVLRVEESKVTYNSAGLGGGGIANGTSASGSTAGGGTVWVWKSAIGHNRTAGLGGGVFDNDGETTITQSHITDNVGRTDVGGVLALHDSRLSLEHVVVANNHTEGEGGGVGVGRDSHAVIEYSVIRENVAEGFGGGGVYTDDFGTTTLRDTEVVANQAVSPGAVGGGLVNDFGTTRLVGTKVAHNVATEPPGGIWTNNNRVFIDRKSAVTDNRPTNCQGSPVIPDRCFG